MATNKNQELLLELVKGQAALVTKVDTLHTRLFGGEGQEGALKYLHDKNEELHKEVHGVKEKIGEDLKEFHEKEVKPIEAAVSQLKTDTTVMMWRTGAITTVAGSLAGAGVVVALKRFFGVA